MGKTRRKNIDGNVKNNGATKYVFNNKNNLVALDSLYHLLKEESLKGCVIGGNAVSANYVDYVMNKIKCNDINEYKMQIKNFSRPTADIDVIINFKKPIGFEDLLNEYFGKRVSMKKGNNKELDIIIDEYTPYLSFHFIYDEPSPESAYYKDFVKNAKELSFISKSEEYKTIVADPLDLIIMKLKSCTERVTDKKKITDLEDLDVLFNMTKSNIQDIINKSNNIGYSDKYLNKIEKGLDYYIKYVREQYENKESEFIIKEILGKDKV